MRFGALMARFRKRNLLAGNRCRDQPGSKPTEPVLHGPAPVTPRVPLVNWCEMHPRWGLLSSNGFGSGKETARAIRLKNAGEERSAREAEGKADQASANIKQAGEQAKDTLA